MERKEENSFVCGVKDIAAGSIRGMTQVFVGHPLDTIKVRLQTQSGAEAKFNGIYDCVTKTFKHVGIMGFYKGAQSPLYMAAVYSAVLFFTYGQAKRIFHSDGTPLNTLKMLKIGLTTGFCSALVEAPLDLVKSKMQIQYQSHGTPGAYRSSVHCATHLVRNYGFRSLYQGFDTTLMRNMPGSIVYFFTYEKIVELISSRTSGQLTPGKVILAGGTAGTLYWISVFPIDMVKTRRQTDSSVKSQRLYKNTWDCVQKVYVKEGIGAFYKGFGVCMIRAFPTNAACFVAYEYSRALMG